MIKNETNDIRSKEKQRTIIGLFLYVNEVIDNLERIKGYLKSLKAR